VRRKTPILVGLAVVVVAFGWSPTLAAATSGPASTARPSPPNTPQSEVRRALAGRVSTGSAVRQPNTAVGCTTLFTPVSSPNNIVATNELESVSPISATDIWAVGLWNSGATSAPDQSLAEHWNGSTWTIVTTPNVGNGFNDLYGVAGNDPNDVWAVGSSQNAGVGYTLALHWNGAGWGAVSTPQPSTSNQYLGSVSALATNDVWAVGAFINGAGLYQTLAVHWNGSAWSTVTTPNAGAGNNLFGGVFMRTPTDGWAVGYYRASPGTANPRLTLLEHYDGSVWTIVTSPSPLAGGDNVLLSVSATSATDAWAVGYTTNSTPLFQTLTEHLVSGTWTTVASPNIASGDNVLAGLVTISPSNAWAVGYGRTDNVSAAFSPLTEHWDGSTWTSQTSSGSGSNGNFLFGVAALPGNNVYAVGGAIDVNSHEQTLVTQFQLPPPTSVMAVAGDQSAMVSWSAPSCDGGFTTTGYLLTAYDGCTVQASMSAPATPLSATFTGLTNGSPFSFTVQAVSASLGAETPSAPSAAVIPTGSTVPVALSACSRLQYHYLNPDPATFIDMDPTNLILTVTPSATSLAVISANVDLWTANAGVNQDIGIFVSGGTFGTGQVVGWKESGGLAGTFSPNAAAVQSVVPLSASTTYTVKLQWKSNRALTGATIFAGAGPLPSVGQIFSPTRLSMRLIPTAGTTLLDAITNLQYHLTGSDGQTWQDIDTTGLSLSVSPSVDTMAVITGNSDLWTANAGYNQDVAINVDGTIRSWKESGGFAGTFSPNAAFLQAVVPLTAAGSPHTIKLQWKANQNAPSKTIYAGAGPWPSGSSTFSPTSLLVQLVPATNIATPSSTLQYNLPNSDGAGWTPIDNTTLKISTAPPGATTFYSLLVTGNADLWTANAGFNQDIGIFISGGVYGAGTLVAWKESGGLAGTFSPNAAYVETVQHLQGGASYVIWLAWKTNKQGAGSTIYAAAGPWPSGSATFSPTRLTALGLSSP